MYLNFVEMKVDHLVYKRELRFSEQYVFTNVCVLITFVSRRTELQSLEVTVIATPLSYPPSSIFPVPGQGNRNNRITHGRNGGSRQP